MTARLEPTPLVRVPSAIQVDPRRLLGLVVDTGVPVLFFTLMVWAKGVRLTAILAEVMSAPSQLLIARAVHDLLTVAFLGMVTILYLVRRPPLYGQAALRDRVVALTGAFILTALALLPPAPVSLHELLWATVAMAVGQGIALLGLVWLRRCFAIAPEARGLVTSGPYRLVRHPLYAGEFIMGGAMVVPVVSLPALLIFTAFCVLQLMRARLEEAALTRAFPDAYPAYAAKTPRFIPGLL